MDDVILEDPSEWTQKRLLVCVTLRLGGRGASPKKEGNAMPQDAQEPRPLSTESMMLRMLRA
jgi:hypothetical protein